MPFAFRRKRKFTFRKRAFGYGGIRKRRYAPRRKYVRRRARASRPELKSMWVAPAAHNFNTLWGGAQDITNTTITIGTDSYNRIGRVICVRKLQFLIDVVPNPASVLATETARLVIWRQNSQIGNASQWADLYDVGRQLIPDMSNWGIRVPGNKNYTVLYDKRINLTTPAATFATPSTIRHSRRITLKFRKGLRINYSAAGAGYTETTRPNQLWFNTLGEQGIGAAYPTGRIGFKIWFTDV